MYQPPTNFIGRDSMQWWIGQVTDPDKGKWGDSLEKKQADDGEDIYSFRCRVRIVGYHGNDDDLPDEELPLAHVLLPPNTATTGGCGSTLQYQGGEVVVGFFFDGEDGQQPVIFGTLFKQTFIPDDLTTQQFNAKKQTAFVPYTPPKVRQRAGKQRQHQSSPWGGGFTPGELAKTIAAKQKEASTNITIDNFTACEDNEVSKISNNIKSFTRKLETLQQLNEQNSYVDPIYGGIIDVQEEIKLTTTLIHNSTTKLVRRARSWLIQDTLDKLSTTLKDKTPKTLQAPVGQATKSLSDVIFCNIEKIQDDLVGYLGKSLENMIGQVADVPVCGVENFLGDMFGQINNIIDSNLGNTFSQLNNIQGGGIALPSKTFSKAIKFANIITNVLDCDKLNCPENSTFSSKNGVSKSIEDSFDNVISNIGLNSLINPLIDDIEGAIPASPTKPDCQTNILKCGPPRVDFRGGSGTGATGTAIVNALGNIIGVAINGTGFGFETPPILSFFDSCDKGYGAGGYPIMGPVSKLTEGTGVSIGGVGGVQLTSNNLPVTVGAIGGIPVTSIGGQPITINAQTLFNSSFISDNPARILDLATLNGQTVSDLLDGKPLTIENLAGIEIPLIAGGIGGVPVFAGGTGGIPLNLGDSPIIINGEGGQGLIAGAFPVVVGSSEGFDGFKITVGGESDADSLYVPDPNGNSLGVVGAVITSPGQEYLSNTTETDLDGNVKEVIPNPNENYDGEQSYVTELDDVIIENTGFGYGDNDTATVDGGDVGSSGDTLRSTDSEGNLTPTTLPDGSSSIQKPGQAQVELTIQDGLVVDANVINGGFGFTKLPEILINSDTGVGAKLSPVLKFTKVDDASKLAEETRQAAITVISCIQK